MILWVLAWLVVINCLTAAVFRHDKAAATAGRHRISERTLHGLAAIGGVGGALWAMYGVRPHHKTRKPGFVAIEAAILVGYMLLAGASWWWSGQ